MVSDRQKEFNKHLDGYLRKLPKKPKISSRRVFFQKKSVKEKPEVLEQKELEKADEEIGKIGFFSRIFDWVFGSEAKVVDEKDFEKEVEIIERPGQEEIQEVQEKKKRSYLKTLMTALWGEKKIVEYEEEQPEIRKVVLIKPAVEQELKFVLKLMDVLMNKMNKREKDKFLESREYKVYKKIKQKHS